MAGFTATGVGRLGQSEGFERPRLIVEGRDGPVRAALGRSACPERHAPAVRLRSAVVALQQAAQRSPAQHQPLRVSDSKGWGEERGRGPCRCPLPPRRARSSAGRAMSSCRVQHAGVGRW